MSSFEQVGHEGVGARVVKRLRRTAGESRVSDVRIGLGFTAVMLEDGRTGVAYTFRDQTDGCCEMFKGMRPLAARPASNLLALLESRDVIEAGVGLACANALANAAGEARPGGDILDHLDLRPTDDVAMIGRFGPLVDPIQQRVRSLTVFERVERPSGMLRPQQEAPATLPHCQVALITATAIINRTVDGLLEAARRCREVVVLGASTPFVPEAFDSFFVTMLSGVVVEQPLEVLRVVSEGGGMQQFSPYVRKVTMKFGGSLAIAEGHEE